MRTLAVMAAALALPLTACGNEAGADGTGGSLKGRSFLSTSVTEDGKAKQLAASTRVQFQFTDDGRLIADAGCNMMQAPVSTDGGKLAVKDLATTEMGCDAPRHAQDSWLAAVLQQKPTWKLDANQLNVTAGKTSLVLQDKAVTQPELPLDGTKWTLESLINGETASHPTGAEKAHLTIRGERVTGSTGCNDLQGIVSRTGDKLTFGEIATTARACSGDAGALEKAILTVLQRQLTFAIKVNRLSLRGTGGTGLDLTSGK
jgi:heat shock protein HslJ